MILSFKQFLKENGNVEKAWDLKAIPVPSFGREDDPHLAQYTFIREKIISEFGEERFKQLESGKNVLFRGFANGYSIGQLATIDSANAVRYSRDTNNLYQLMISQSEAQKHIPDRSSSLICSTDWRKASRFGKIYAVLPYPSVKSFGYVDAEDMFDITLKLGSLAPQLPTIGVEKLSRALGHVLQLIGVSHNDPSNKRFNSAAGLNAAFAKVDPETLGMIWAMCFTRPSTLSLISSNNQIGHADDINALNEASSLVRAFIDFGAFADFAEVKRIASSALKVLKNPNVQRNDKSGRVELMLKTVEAISQLASKGRDKFFTNLSTRIFNNESTTGIHHAQSVQQIPADTECWFSGKCMIVDFRMIQGQ